LKLLAPSFARRRSEYEPDRAGCFACARCFESCPQERARRGWAVGEIAAQPAQAKAP